MQTPSVPAMTPGGSRIRLPVKPHVEELLLWRDPKKSGAVFGMATLVFLFIQFSKINVIATTAYAFMSVVLGAFLWNNIASFTKKAPVPVPRLLKEGLSDTEVKAYAERFTVHANKGLAFTNRLATGREPVLTGTVVGVLYLVAKLAGIFSLVGLAYTAVLAAFTLPKVYELKKDEIDGAVDKARSQTTTLYDKHLHKYVEKIPRYSGATPAESTTKMD